MKVTPSEEIDGKKAKEVVNSEEGSEKLEILLKNAFAILFTMKLCGVNIQPENRRNGKVGNTGSNVWIICSATMAAVQWLNVIRASTAITKNDKFDSNLFIKITTILFFLTGASVQTVTLYAFKSKALHNVLKDLSSFQLEMRNILKFSRLFAAIFWSCLALNIFNSMYQMFAYEGPEIISDLMILPFNVYFDLKNEVVIFLKFVGLILTTLSYASAFGANSFNLLISIVLKYEFTKLRRKLEYLISCGDGGAEDTLKECSNTSKPDLKIEFIKLRKCHQKLAKIVENADKFICLWSGCVIVCEVSIAILVLYNIISYNDIAIIFINFTYLMGATASLFCTTAGAILVNISVSE